MPAQSARLGLMPVLKKNFSSTERTMGIIAAIIAVGLFVQAALEPHGMMLAVSVLFVSFMTFPNMERSNAATFLPLETSGPRSRRSPG